MLPSTAHRTLYHYKKEWGTTTHLWVGLDLLKIIPLQERMGNYNFRLLIVPISLIIPLQERMGNYNGRHRTHAKNDDYTTTRKNGELQHAGVVGPV